MSIPFANFDQTSQLSSSPHDPVLSLASNCIRDYFGPTVQMVADGLMFRGEPITFNMLVATLRQKCRQKVYSEERKRLLGSKVAARLKNQTLQLPPLRAALLVLVQHNIVKLTVKQSRPSGISSSSSNSSGKVVYRYHLDMTRARMLPRYPRYVEYTKKAVDATSATLVEELLVQGRLRTADAVQKTFESLQSLEAETVDEANDGQQDETLDNNTATTLPTIVESSTTSVTSASNATKTTTLQSVLDAFKRLVQAGFLEQVPRLADEDQANAEGATAEVKEFEFDEPVPEPPTKKVKIDKSEENDRSLYEDEDPVIVASLQGSAYRDFLPRHAVWRVNIHMFHDALRAFALGRLTSERYGHKVQSAGSMISAALKYLANKKHANKKAKNDRDDECNIEEQTFQAADVLRYLPKAVLQLLERKRKAAATVNKSLSVVSQVAKSLQQLSANDSPVCVLEVEVGAKPEDSKFEICVSRMVKYMQERITNRMLVDHHGEIAARIVTILLLNGHLESDSLAESAMVPAKDTREILHRLYRSKYIDLFTLNQSRQHNPSNMIYLWSVVDAQILRNVTNNVCTALLNLRLRRQHEVDIGKNWIERAQEAGDMDENDHDADKLNHRKFCLGLERLYNSCLQLDETLMVLEDF